MVRTYAVRCGTIDFGREYEFKIATLLSLKCVTNENMWLAMNVADCGQFDDIVLYQEKADGTKLTSLIQIKYQERSKKIDVRDFRMERGNFSLKRYWEGVSSIVDICKSDYEHGSSIQDHLRKNIDNLEFVLFTNRAVTDMDYFKLANKKSTFSLHSSIYTQGCISQFDFEKVDIKLKNNLKTELVDNFFLFSEQIQTSDVDYAIENEIANLIKPMKLSKRLLREINYKLSMFIIDWSSGKLGGNFVLTKNYILEILLEFIVRPYMFNFKDRKVSDRNRFHYKIWKRIIEENDILLIEKDDLVIEFLSNYFLSQIDNYNETFDKNHNNKKIWNGFKYPFIVVEILNENLKEFLVVIKKLQVNFKVIILSENVEKITQNEHCKILVNFKDLNEELQREILSYNVRLQSRSSVKLSDIIHNKEIYSCLRLKDIIHIICNNFNIGNELTSLPDNFIIRSLDQIWLNPKVLQETSNDVFVIKCHKVDFEIFLDKFEVEITNIDSRIILCEDQTQIDVDNDCKDPIHWLVLHSKSDLEWIRSYGTTNNIIKFRKNFGRQRVEDFCTSSKIKLISACPGMGKTVLMDYVAISASTSVWVLRINLLNHAESFYTTFDCNLTKFLLNLSLVDVNNPLETLVFQEYLLKKQIMVILDGFDEIPLNCQKEAEEVIKSLKDENYDVFITTRPILKTKLEKLLDVFAVTINPLTKNEQVLFLERYVNSQNDVSKLLDKVKDDFASVPLQAKLLAEIYVNNYENFADCNVFALYKNFIESKLKIACQKFGTLLGDFVDTYKNFRSLYALKTLFSENDLNQFNINSRLSAIKKTFPNTFTLMEKDGIMLVEDGFNAKFVHHTFAEYLAAEWLYENRHENNKTIRIFIKRMFESKFSTLRNIFDCLLSKDLVLHTSVVNKQFEKAITLVSENPQLLRQVDEGKRSILHLIAAWEFNVDILKLVPYEFIENEEDLFGYTPLDYALMNGSYEIANIICAKLNGSNFRLFVENLTLNVDINQYGPLFLILLKNTILNEVEKSVEELKSIQLRNNELHQKMMERNIKYLSFALDSTDSEHTRNELNYTFLRFTIIIYEDILLTHALSLNKSIINLKDKNGRTCLHWAVINGNSEIVQVLLSNGIDPTIVDNNGMSALHYAIILNRNEQIVLDLLENRSDIGMRDYYGCTPLHYVLQSNNTGLLEMFLKVGANINFISKDCSLFSNTDFEGLTILHWASIRGLTEVTNLLIEHGADPNRQDDEGKLPLHWAAQKGHYESVKLLSSYSNITSKDKQDRTALYFAIINGHNDIVTLLLDKGAIIHNNYLNEAVSSGYTEIIKTLLANGTDINGKNVIGRNALHIAAENGFDDIISLLLAKGFNIDLKDKNEQTALIIASSRGLNGTIGLLLNNGANLEATDVENSSSLLWASRKGYIDTVEFLLEKGASLNEKTIYGRTALIVAARSQHKNVVELLLLKNANVDERDNGGMTALHWAVKNNNLEITEILLDKADIEQRNSSGETPLLIASKHGYTTIVKFLLSQGAKLEAVDNNRMNALHLAIKHAHPNIVKVLISKDLNLEITEVTHQSALILATSLNNKVIVELILSRNVSTETSDGQGRTALHWAALNGSEEILLLLLNKGAIINKKDKNHKTPLRLAIDNGHKACMDLLLAKMKMEKDINPESYKEIFLKDETLLVAANNGHDEIVDYLLTNGANIDMIDANGMSALHWACHSGHKTTVELLLAKKFNTEVKDNHDLTPLIVASKEGYIDISNILLSNGADVNAKDKEGDTALHWATCNGHERMVKLLLENEIHVDVKDNYGQTALMYAAARGYTEILSLLLSYGCDPNIINDNGKTALHWAAQSGNMEEIRLLILKNAYLEKKDKSGRSSILSAVRSGCINALKLLCFMGADITATDNKGMNALHWAATYGYSDIMKFLISKKYHLDLRNKDGQTALMCAAVNGCMQIVNLLLYKGANINVKDNTGATVIHLASQMGRYEVLKLLLKKDLCLKTVDNFEQTALHWASWNGHTNVVKLILEKSNVTEMRNIYGNTPLLCAIRNGHERTVRLLTEKGANVDVKDINDRTALHLAASSGNVDILELLLHKENVDIKDKYGRTPLISAIIHEREHVVTRLLDCGANVEIVDNKRLSALHWAATNGHLNIFRKLLSKLSNLELTDKSGKTPLICASSFGRLDVADLLLNKKVSIEAKDKANLNALHWATRNNHKEMVRLLLSYGASLEQKDAFGHTVLSRAVFNGYKDIVVLLIDKGANVEAKDNLSMSLLHWAAWKGHADIAEVLINKISNLESRNIHGRTPLLCAAVTECVAVASLLLSKGANTETQDTIGTSALNWAIWRDNFDIVKLFLSKNTSLEIKDKFGRTSLICAAYKGATNTACTLLKMGAQIEARDNEGKTALLCAASNGHVKVVDLLLGNGADINAKDNKSMDVLICAACNGKMDVINVLLSQYHVSVETRDNKNRNALLWSSYKGHRDTTEILIEKGSDLEVKDKSGQTPFILACKKGHLPIVHLLLGKGVNIEETAKNSMHALHFAARNGHKEIVDFILFNSANIEAKDAYNQTPLMLAAKNNRVDVLKMLLFRGANAEALDINRRSTLQIAACNGSIDVIKCLLSTDNNLELKDKNGQTAFILATRNNHSVTAEFLLSQGADINSLDNEKATALHWAIWKNHVKIANLLISEGSNLEARTVYGRTPLICAARYGCSIVANNLVSRKVDVGVKDNEDMNALHWAISRRNCDIIKTLLENGAQVEVKTKGKPPLILAAQIGFVNGVDLLLSYGANIEATDSINRNALHWAVLYENLDIVKLLLCKIIRIEVQDRFGLTPLIIAAKRGCPAIMKVIMTKEVKAGRKIDYKTLLRYATQNGHLNIVRLLISKEIKQETQNKKADD